MDFTFILASIFIALIFFLVFVRQGGGSFFRLLFGKKIKDYGVIGSVPFKGLASQVLSMYKCEDNKEQFFVLESRAPGRIYYVKITDDIAKKMVEILSEK